MKTLQQIALESLKRSLSVFNVIDAFTLSQKFSPTDWSRELQGICTAFVRDSYETLKDVQDTAVLQHCFGTELLQQLEQQSLERQQLLRSLKIRGHVLEQPPLNVPQDPSGPAVSGVGPALPSALLRAGVAWPAGVIPEQREAHLSVAEFEQVFGMSYAAFTALPAWRQLQLKKQHDLF